jgi:chromosome segregation ATPase
LAVSSNAGVVIDAIDDPGALAPAWPRPHGAVRRYVVLAIVLALVAAAVGVALHDVRDAQRAVDRDLGTTNRLLDDEQKAVSTAGSRRAATDALLATTIARLESANDARHQVRVLYDTLERDLKRKREQLQQTSADVKARSDQLDKLNLCLAGVAQAMQQASYGAQNRAIATLQSVAGVCADARPLTGSG